MTIDDINKIIIAEVLYKTSYLESWGSGVKRIIDACRKQNVPDPEWSLRGGFVTVTFRRSTQTSGQKDDREDDSEVIEKVTENPEKVIEKVMEKASLMGEKVTENKIKILKMIIENPSITKAEMSASIGISLNSVSRNIEAMRNKYIRRDGPDKGGHWEIIV